MSVYKVHFKWKEKEIFLTAKSLDMTHPYFVSIKDLIFSAKKKIIIDPTEDEVKNRFGDVEHIMIPFQAVTFIEEYSDEEKMEKVRPFTIVEEKKKKNDDT
jgi:hypothetical protein